MENLLEILNDVVLPTKVSGAKGSKYFTAEIKHAAETVNKGQGFKLPVLEGITGERHKAALAAVLNNYYSTKKTFAVALMEDGTLLVKCLTVKETVEAKVEPRVEIAQ